MANSSKHVGALPARGESGRAALSRRTTRAALALAVAAAALAPMHRAQAQDAAAGRRKAIQCQACHGLDGVAKIPGAPHLAGQVEDYLVKAMHDYKSGARKNEMMTVVMRQLSDADIADLAAYYAGLHPKAAGGR